jgi:hypothetical protein
MTWYEKNMLSKDSMSNVDESVYENNSLGEDPIMSNEPEVDEVEHDPFEFPHDDEIPFSKLLSDPMVWQGQGFDNGDTNMNMPLLDNDVQVSNETPPPPKLYMFQCQNQDTSMQSMGSIEMDPPITANTPLIRIIILKLNAKQTIINILDIKMDPLVNPPNIV